MGRAFEYRKASKLKRWGNMSRVFPKLGRAITMAAKAGVSDPEMNSALRTAILNAKSENMPKTNIEAAIKRADAKDSTNFAEVNFEGKGPHGSLIFVETATDNNNRTVANIRSYFNKCNGTFGTAGSVVFMFDHTCNFTIPKGELDPEELELEFIDYGAEEIFVDGDNIMIYGSFGDFGSIQKALEERELEIVSSGFERIPTVMTKLTDEEQIAAVEKLLEKIEDDDDVLNVFHNMEL